ncbi:uncharacterized mitochondrial protein AtMg00810-like [Gastrolobium bilobum]|uniref:uncharacterized mitochondrial protein AtMg00810-like n=1 Tax=Gastrolobium bilobum TaxID=150636 RepID=UPI002AB24A44|nr:uncharacterized mitochondrial protein AtMg00810-like [Gastrolobium bilobum]
MGPVYLFGPVIGFNPRGPIRTDDSFTVLLIYVDDIVLTGDNVAEIQRVKHALDSQFRIKDMGSLRFFLGLEISRNKSGIAVNKRKYAFEILSDTGLLGAKPSSTPMVPSLHLSHTNGTLLSDGDALSYRRLIGRLLYLTTTCPDIYFSVQQLSQFVGAPTSTHRVAATRVLRYIKGTPATGLFFPSHKSLQLSGFTNLDLACCPDTRRSITGLCIFLGSSFIGWRSKKQPIVSRSSSEAEYRALATMTCKLQWITYILRDLCVPCSTVAHVYFDNISAICLAKNPTLHEHSMHIEIDIHVTREKLQVGLLWLFPATSYDQLADIFTKALHPSSYFSIIAKLGLRDVHCPACEGC